MGSRRCCRHERRLGGLVDYPNPDGGAHRGTSQQQNTHIGELRAIFYSWHPWHDRKVRLHATLVKRGCAVARCSLEDVQPFRILEVPLWMLDAVVCCKVRTAKSGVANVESLRQLKALLESTQRTDLDLAIQAQHRYLLNAGGADARVVEPTEIHAASVVRSSASPTRLAGTVTRDSTKGCAITERTAPAAELRTECRPGSGGGVQ